VVDELIVKSATVAVEVVMAGALTVKVAAAESPEDPVAVTV
jgi:hypothetical protein